MKPRWHLKFFFVLLLIASLVALVVLFLLPHRANAQSTQPNCQVTATYATNGTKAYVWDNRSKQCIAWTVSYHYTTTLTTATVQLQAAPDVGGTPGTWATIVADSTNANTGFYNGNYTSIGYRPWIQIVVTLAGSGSLQFMANGFIGNPTQSGGGGGGGGTTDNMMYTQGSAGSGARTLTSRLQDLMSVRDFSGVLGNGTNDDTAGIASACIAAQNNGQTVYFPPGTYMTQPITSCNKAGMIIKGASPILTTVKSVSGGSVFVPTTGGVLHSWQLRDLTVDGNAGASNIGLDLTQANSSFEVKVDNVWFQNLGGDCVFDPNVSSGGGAGFEIDIDHVQCKSLNGNGIEIGGGPSAVIQNTYVHNIGPGKAGFWCYTSCLILNDNGLDANTNGTWINVGTTSPARYGGVTIMNSNIEAFGSIGVHVLNGFFSMYNTGILADLSGATNVQAIRYEGTYSSGVSIIDAQSGIGALNGNTWLNGTAIHGVNGCSPLMNFNSSGATTTCYNEANSASYPLPTFTTTPVNANLIGLTINELYTPDLYIFHDSAFGGSPSVSGTNQFCAGTSINGHDTAGLITIGSGACGNVGQIFFASVFNDRAVACDVQFYGGPEISTVNIAAASGGTSTVSYVSGTTFNTGWPQGLPFQISGPTGNGVLNNQTLQAVTSTTALTITPGVTAALSGVSLSTYPRDHYIRRYAQTSNLTISSMVNFVPGDVYSYKCKGIQ